MLTEGIAVGNLYIGLLHFPMRDRRGDIVATATTSMDVHDIARTARTYGVVRYFVITPLPSQREIAWRIRGFWSEGEQAVEKSRRGEAIEIVDVLPDIEGSIDWISATEGTAPLLVATSAQAHVGQAISYDELRRALRSEERPIYILFGTGWGMADELIESCDLVLPPIMGESGFNHLSVRAAVAITLDRVAGDNA